MLCRYLLECLCLLYIKLLHTGAASALSHVIETLQHKMLLTALMCTTTMLAMS